MSETVTETMQVPLQLLELVRRTSPGTPTYLVSLRHTVSQILSVDKCLELLSAPQVSVFQLYLYSSKGNKLRASGTLDHITIAAGDCHRR